MFSISLSILLAASAVTPTFPQAAAAQTESDFGAVMAPAVLPKGSNSLYGYLGAPEVGVGYRQGFWQQFEFETLGRFNYLQLALNAEFGFRAPLYRDPNDRAFLLSMAVYLGAGYSTGNKYFDAANFRAFDVTARANILGTYRVNPVLYVLGRVEAPLWLPLTAQGLSVAPTGGLGIEVRLGDGLSLLAFGSLGAEVRKEPLGVFFVRPAWALQLGVGTRFF